jgi:hypothetical protein
LTVTFRLVDLVLVQPANSAKIETTYIHASHQASAGADGFVVTKNEFAPPDQILARLPPLIKLFVAHLTRKLRRLDLRDSALIR